MRQKIKYLIKVWFYNNGKLDYYSKKINGNAEQILWKRKLKRQKKIGTIEKFEITKIE